MRFPSLLHLVAYLPINTNLLTSYVSVLICQNILNSSLSWSKNSERNPRYKLYAFQPATVLANISSFLCLTLLCLFLCFINCLTQIAPFFFFSEAVAQRSSVKKVFLEISQNSQENTCARVTFFSYKTSPVASVFFKCLFVLPIRFTLRYLPPPSTSFRSSFSVFNFVFGRSFLQKKKKKRKEKNIYRKSWKYIGNRSINRQMYN